MEKIWNDGRVNVEPRGVERGRV